MIATGESITEGLDLSGRRIVVTGASSGLGREAARVLALRGADVGLACRNAAKAAVVVQDFVARHGDGIAARCELLDCDLERMDSVRALAAKLVASGRRIDVLLLNAGVFSQRFRVSPDGFESTLASNYLGHFLLVHLLAAGGALAPDARIVSTLTTAVHSNRFAKADLDLLFRPEKRKFSAFKGSPGSKVMLALLAHEFGRRVTGTPFARITFVGVAPGGVQTGSFERMRPWQRRMAALVLGGLLRPVQQGAAPLVWAATAPEAGRGPSGVVFDRELRTVKLNPQSSDLEAAKRLWSESERALGLPSWP